jgi:hypothetical protein
VVLHFSSYESKLLQKIRQSRFKSCFLQDNDLKRNTLDDFIIFAPEILQQDMDNQSNDEFAFIKQTLFSKD